MTPKDQGTDIVDRLSERTRRVWIGDCKSGECQIHEAAALIVTLRAQLATARADAMEEAARILERRADEIAAASNGNISGMMARIFRDEAAAIRQAGGGAT